MSKLLCIIHLSFSTVIPYMFRYISKCWRALGLHDILHAIVMCISSVKTVLWLAVNLLQLFSNGAAFNTQSCSSRTSYAIHAQNHRCIACRETEKNMAGRLIKTTYTSTYTVHVPEHVGNDCRQRQMYRLDWTPYFFKLDCFDFKMNCLL